MSKITLRRSQSVSPPPPILMGTSSGYLEDDFGMIEAAGWDQGYTITTIPHHVTPLALEMLGGSTFTSTGARTGTAHIVGGNSTYISTDLRTWTTQVIGSHLGTNSNAYSYAQGSLALGAHIAAISAVPFTYITIDDLFPKRLEQRTSEFDLFLRQEPVLDGFDHPGQAALEAVFSLDPDGAGRWMLAKFKDEKHPSVAADTIRLLLRFKPHTEEWRREVVALGLASTSVEIRDASVQAVEAWAEASLIALLKSHNESADWLREYLEQVLRDLEA